jgi:hypothetical protein
LPFASTPKFANLNLGIHTFVDGAATDPIVIVTRVAHLEEKAFGKTRASRNNLSVAALMSDATQ